MSAASLDALRDAAFQALLEVHRAEMAAHLMAAVTAGPQAARARRVAVRLAAMDCLAAAAEKATTAEETVNVLGEIARRTVSAVDMANIAEVAGSLSSIRAAQAAADARGLPPETASTLTSDVISLLRLTTLSLQEVVASERFAWVAKRPPRAWTVYWRILKAGVRVLPEESRYCFLEDWMSTFSELDTRWSRAHFTLSILTAGIPRLAWTLRRSEPWSGSL